MERADQSLDTEFLNTAEAGAREHPPGPSHRIGMKRLVDLKG